MTEQLPDPEDDEVLHASVDAASPDAASPDDDDHPSRSEILLERVKESEAQLKAKYSELETRRGESAPIDVAFRVIEADRRVAGGLISGGMAFRIFVVTVPFAFVLVGLFGAVGESVDASDPVALAKDMGMTGLVASAINASVNTSTLERIVTLLAAAYALLWGTWTLIRATRAVHGLAWDLPKLPPLRRPWRPTLFAIGGMFVAFFVGVGISNLVDDAGLLEQLAAQILLLGAVIAGWIAISTVLPRAEGTTWRALAPGAVLFGVGAWALQLVTVYFFSRYIANKTETYGAIGASLAILLWAYFAGRLIVTAAFLNEARWRRSRPPAETAEDAPPGSR